MRVGLLIDGSGLARWQADALAQLDANSVLSVYNCTNTPSPRRRLRHWPYYLLNLASLRTQLTRHVSLPSTLHVADTVDFESELDGLWQKLPKQLIDRLKDDGVECILKFGLGLLRVPEQGELPIPILSYHHGDPRAFRGRPAGFNELLTGRRTVGQIIQVISNRIDAGKCLAFAETPVHHHSYRETMREAYATSRLLLPKAITALRNGQALDLRPEGKVTRLPSAWTVLRFVAQRLIAQARRLAYGAFFEKRWQVAVAPLPATAASALTGFPLESSWRTLVCPPGFRFLADPFPHPISDGILVEALNSATGVGEILHVDDGRATSLLRGDGHFSFPATIATADGPFLVPEVCEWSEPRIYRLDGSGATPAGTVDLDRTGGLVDPILAEREGTTYLFANRYSDGDYVLRLWTAPSIYDRFEEHPSSPILISPKGARMGGLLCASGGSLYRIGQDGSGRYGDGVLMFRIDALSPTEYRESLADQLKFGDYHGPHTINWDADKLLFDFYRNRFDLLAGVRRLKARLARRNYPPSEA